MTFFSKMNRALSLILVLVLIVGLLPVNAFATDTGDILIHNHAECTACAEGVCHECAECGEPEEAAEEAAQEVAETSEPVETVPEETTSDKEKPSLAFDSVSKDAMASEVTATEATEATVPEETVPEETVPEETVSEETKPSKKKKPGLSFSSVSKDAMTGEVATAEEDPNNDQKEIDYLFIGSDLHMKANDASVLTGIINNMESYIGKNELDYLALAGDMTHTDYAETHVPFNSSTILNAIREATTSLDDPNVKIVSGVHDAGGTDDAGIMQFYGSGGQQIFEGNNYYVYGVEEFCISDDLKYIGNTPTTPNYDVPSYDTYSDKEAQYIITEAEKFVTWANEKADPSKAIIVVSHYPLHAIREDNDGAYIWHMALNTVATGAAFDDSTVERDIVFLHGHNHTKDLTEYVYNVGDVMKIQDGTDAWHEFVHYTYATAGYLRDNKVSTLISITDDTITLEKYGTSGAGERMATVYRTGPHYHSYEVESSTVTCTEAGTIIYACACGSRYAEESAALGHDHKAAVTEPTCTVNGYTTYTCSRCGDSYVTDETPATGHNYTTTVVEPTCAEGGYTLHICYDCGDSYKTDEVGAKNHNYEHTYQEPTCLRAGGDTYTCTTCGHNYTDVKVALGHDYVTETLVATCTTPGYTTHTCSRCNNSYTDGYVAAPGHKYISSVTEATCTTYGYTTQTCTVCNESAITNSSAPLGHDYSSTQEGNIVTYTCNRCTDSYTMEVAGDTYTYENVTAFTAGNHYVVTVYSDGTYYALSHKDNKLSPVAVTVTDNQITSAVTDDLLWDYNTSNKLFYESDGTTYYIYAASSIFGNPSLKLSTSSSTTVSLNNERVQVGSYYLRFASNKISLSKSASSGYLYQQMSK